METTATKEQPQIHPPGSWFYSWRDSACDSCSRKSTLDATSWELVKANESWQMKNYIGIARRFLERYSPLDKALVAMFTNGCGLYKHRLEKEVSLKQVNTLCRLADQLAKRWWSIISLIAARQIRKTINIYYGLEECAGCSKETGLVFPYEVLGLHDDDCWYCQGCHEGCVYRELEDRPEPPGQSPITFNHRYLPWVK
jgi:hypothetical protein